jgi:YHS domain-containing protein
LTAGHKEADNVQIRKTTIQIALLTCAALVLATGCSSEQQASDTTSEKQTTAGRAVEQAKIVVAELSNPKEGFDPVCYMKIDESAVTVTMDDGKTYGFCSKNCADKFTADPSKYLASADGHDDHEGHNH